MIPDILISSGVLANISFAFGNTLFAGKNLSSSDANRLIGATYPDRSVLSVFLLLLVNLRLLTNRPTGCKMKPVSFNETRFIFESPDRGGGNTCPKLLRNIMRKRKI